MTPFLRESTEVRLHTLGEWIVKLVIGAIVFAFGAVFLALDYKIAISAKETPHLTHIAIFAGIAVLGLLVPFAPFMLPVVQKIIIIAGPFIPGGSRAGDPPAPPTGGVP